MSGDYRQAIANVVGSHVNLEEGGTQLIEELIVAFQELLPQQPPNAEISLHELTITHYLDEAGQDQVAYGWQTDEAPYIHALGMLEATKLAMARVAWEDADEEANDD